MCPSSILATAFRNMDFTVLRIGDVTDNGNVTVTMQFGENVSTPLGEVVNSRIARAVVRAESLSVEAGAVVELDMEETFKFETSPYTIPDGENAGQVVNLTWIRKR